MSDAQIVPAPAFARTYSPEVHDDPWEQVTEYLDLLEYYDQHPTMTRGEVAEELGIPQAQASRWLNGRIPNVVKGLQRADELGWTAMPWDSPLGHAFNVFVAALYAKGSFTPPKSPQLTLPDRTSSETVEELKAVVETLVGGYEIQNEADPEKTTTLLPDSNGTLFGRALKAIGVSQSPKKRPGFGLPAYLERVSPELRREFVEVYTLIRASSYPESEKMDIRAERTQEYLRDLADLFEDVTGVEPTVRTNGIYLPIPLVEQLDLQIRFRERLD